MISLRFFQPKASQYLIQQRQFGLKKLAGIELHRGFTTKNIGDEGQSSQKLAQDDHADVAAKLPLSQTNDPNFTGEWQGTAGTKSWFIEKEEGYDVPEVFRQHRHAYSSKPETAEAYRKQILYRCGHIGTKEIEIILRDYLKMNADKMTYEELEQFDNDVLDVENPSLYRYLVNGDTVEEQHKNKYVNLLVEYVEKRKTNY